VEVGTAREVCGNLTNDSASRTDQGGQLTQTNRRQSIMSAVSFLSLPPAYSQLHTRSGSMCSLETRMFYATLSNVRKKLSLIFLLQYLLDMMKLKTLKSYF